MATAIVVPFCRLLPAMTLVVAGFFISGGASLAVPAVPAVTYCAGCLCDDTPPDMSVPGDWRPSGGMVAGRIVLKFVPRDQGARLAGSCRPSPRA